MSGSSFNPQSDSDLLSSSDQPPIGASSAEEELNAYGDFESKSAALEVLVGKKNHELIALKKSVQTLKGQLQKEKADKSGLQNALAEADDEIDKLQKELSQEQQKHKLILKDLTAELDRLKIFEDRAGFLESQVERYKKDFGRVTTLVDKVAELERGLKEKTKAAGAASASQATLEMQKEQINLLKTGLELKENDNKRLRDQLVQLSSKLEVQELMIRPSLAKPQADDQPIKEPGENFLEEELGEKLVETRALLKSNQETLELQKSVINDLRMKLEEKENSDLVDEAEMRLKLTELFCAKLLVIHGVDAIQREAPGL